ncbi:prolyl endopeptidase-like [Corticium candelabrum]|uniref:prolyl endopeptidase-like n=1 Tax=Corticium candelabrum TaxID=121492 RepID=UPI002E257615|nr:prolyl endopeptidase-like [Corticium candelabrum]
MTESWTYPKARRDETVADDYHGTLVSDPYRWLEDPDSEETKTFVEAQNAISLPFIRETPLRERFHARMTELYNFERYGCPSKHGDRYYYFYNTGLQNHNVMYCQDSLVSEARVFLNPNEWSDDGTIALKVYKFSEDGKLFAFGKSSSGSDWITIHVMNVDTGHQLSDTLQNAKFTSMAWTHDNKGFFYSRYPESSSKSDGTETDINLNHKLYYHVVGTEQHEDILCCEFPDNPKWMIGAEVTDDGHYLVLGIYEGCDPVNRLYYCDLTLLSGIKGILPFVKLVDNFDAEYEYICNDGTLFTFKTNLNAPRYKLINIDFNKPEMEHWSDKVAEHEKDVLEWATGINQNRLVLCYLSDVKNVLQLHDMSTSKHLITFPLEVGTVCGFSGKRKHSEMFYHFVSFLTPGIIYHCNFTDNDIKTTVFRQITVKGFDQSQFQVVQVFYPSKDGVKVPMFIVHRKDLKFDGQSPVFLYGYGGFNVSLTPGFSVTRVIRMQHMGGVIAVPNLRGGGEYGETWHKAGMLANKQNVFDDFQSAAEYLIEHKYSSADKMIISGGSNGGLLVAACSNQRPDLFKCAIAHVGVMDMLRFHKFTIGHAWTTDYGCADKPDNFKYLIKYSPLHNVSVGVHDAQYPAALLLTADHDDRVVPLHSLKLIATLQHTLGNSEKQVNPLMILVDMKSGHGAGKPTAKVIDENSDVNAFVSRVVGIEWTE